MAFSLEILMHFLLSFLFVFALGPVLTIIAINTLFSTGIPLTFATVGAVDTLFIVAAMINTMGTGHLRNSLIVFKDSDEE